VRAVVAMASRAVARGTTRTAGTARRAEPRAATVATVVNGGGASGGRRATGWTTLEDFVNARGRTSGGGGGRRGGGSTGGGGRGGAEDAAARRGARAMATAVGLDPGSRIQIVLAKIAMRDAMDALGVFEYEEDEDT